MSTQPRRMAAAACPPARPSLVTPSSRRSSTTLCHIGVTRGWLAPEVRDDAICYNIRRLGEADHSQERCVAFVIRLINDAKHDIKALAPRIDAKYSMPSTFIFATNQQKRVRAGLSACAAWSHRSIAYGSITSGSFMMSLATMSRSLR